MASRLSAVLCAISIVLATAVLSTPALAAPAGSSTVDKDKLSPRLSRLAAAPHLLNRPAKERAQQVGVNANGPGSLQLGPGGTVTVTVRLNPDAPNALAAVQKLSESVTNTDATTATVVIQAQKLTALANLPEVQFVAEALEPFRNAACPTGAVVSEAVTHLKAAAAQTAYGVDGSGITIGIVSDSFDKTGGAATDVANADLPGAANPCGNLDPVNPLSDAVAGSGDEGRAMAQLIHDVAPGAQLLFADHGVSSTHMAQHIRDLAAAGADIIVDDVIYFDEPMFQDGVIAAAINDVTAQGVLYFSAAGNFNQILNGQSVASYEAPQYRPTACPAAVQAYFNALPMDCHDFNPGAPIDATWDFSVISQLSMLLGWSEPDSGVTTDLDMCLIDATNGSVLRCEGADNVSWGFAGDWLIKDGLAAPQQVSLVVARTQGTGTPRFKLIAAQGRITATEYPTSSGGDIIGPTSYGHSASASSTSVAAVSYASTTSVEAFSSRGPALTCWEPVTTTGAVAAPMPCNSTTIDLAATDGAQTSFFGNLSGGVYRFYGTSAAAPHAAGAAALVRQIAPCLSPAQVLAVLQQNTRPVGSTGVNASGAGLVTADAAVAAAADSCSTANPPAERTLTTNTGGVPVYASATSSVVVGTLPAATTVHASLGTSNGRVNIVYGTTGGWVDQQWLVSNPSPAVTRYTTTNGIPVHLGPGSGYYLAGSLGAGVQVQVSTQPAVNGWVNIKFGSTGGWIPQQWLTTPPTVEKTYFANTGGIPVYFGPSAAYPVAGYLGAPASIGASGSSPTNGYVHVAFGSAGGWVLDQWLVSNPDSTGFRAAVTSGIPVYLGPGSGYYFAGWISVGTQVQVSGIERNGYLWIQYGATGGWVPRQWFTAPTAVSTWHTNTGGVPVKSSASATSGTLAILAAGTAVGVTADAPVNGYVKVSYGASGGWVSQAWLVQNPQNVQPRVATTSGIAVYLGPGAGYHHVGWISVDTVVQASSTTKNGYVLIQYGSTGGWVSQNWFTGAQGSTFYANTGGVPVYSGPGSSYSLIKTIPAGTAVATTGTVTNGHREVRLGSGTGWVPQQWLVQNPATTRTLVATTSGISAHLGPGSGYHFAGWISAGTVVQASSTEQNGYVLIEHGNTGAWVPRKWFA